jgi:hypothetical protein
LSRATSREWSGSTSCKVRARASLTQTVASLSRSESRYLNSDVVHFRPSDMPKLHTCATTARGAATTCGGNKPTFTGRHLANGCETSLAHQASALLTAQPNKPSTAESGNSRMFIGNRSRIPAVPPISSHVVTWLAALRARARARVIIHTGSKL